MSEVASSSTTRGLGLSMRNEGWCYFGISLVGRSLRLLAVVLSTGFGPAAALGQFSPRVDYLAGPQPFSIAIGDLNNDTHPDLVVGHGTGNLSAYFGVGDGTFSPAVVSNGAGFFGRNIVLTDLNSDPWPDPIMADEGGRYVLLYSGTQSGSFATPYRMETPGPAPSHVALGDLNEDGILDIAVTNWGNPGSVGIHLGKGSGSFDTALTYQTLPGPRGIAIADINQDSHLDLVVTIEGYTGIDLSQVSVLLGTGTGTFGVHTDYPVDLMPHGVAVSDLNGDLKPDIVTAGQDGKVAVLLNNGSGFDPKTEYEAGGWHFSVVLADFDGDGILDIATPDAGFYYDVGRIAILGGVGDGTFEPSVYHDTYLGPITIAAADLNHDGMTDLAAAAYGNFILDDSYVSVLLNCGTCTSTAIELALLDVRADETGVHLRWNVHEPDGSEAVLERKTRDTDWTEQQRVNVTGSLLELTDSNVYLGQEYAYRLVVHSPDGIIETPEIWVQAAGSPIPRSLTLNRPSPNPTEGALRVRFGIPSERPTDLAVFDVAGRLVARVSGARRAAGWYDAVWDGRDQAGRQVASGTYFLRLTAGEMVTRRVVILR
jgi:hypothetical protein